MAILNVHVLPDENESMFPVALSHFIRHGEATITVHRKYTLANC